MANPPSAPEDGGLGARGANCVADAIAKRGDALDLNRLFMQTPLPMVLVCNDLHVQAANPAGQLIPAGGSPTCAAHPSPTRYLPGSALSSTSARLHCFAIRR
jgi:hypothetical protein